ncbi:hypothetical protein NDS46_30530 (plasmid) [Paenibacillus thiaminolyticus]|uniref:hypothetical protein n=1 Tax=Paenibacillus thiaminolyticus TaxID=49283 RepID=UPI00232CD385|nr:hypothetical protein [Paenibacillus thiaminolyticus]WCF11686.1 hypothetical protein NDS46_30530 [Paenibacillus thiaminolyticus]
MNKNELRITLGQAYKGAVLARDVFKDRDMLLIGKGFTLTETLIEKLRSNGVKHIYIVSEENQQ